jgi:glucokinase
MTGGFARRTLLNVSQEQLLASLASSRGTVVAIDFGGTKIDVALADDAGTLLDRVRLDTLAARGADQAPARTAEAVKELARRAEVVHGTPVTGCAAVSPGAVQTDRILLASNLPGWENLPLASRLQQELGVETIAVCNEVHAGALAELRFGALVGVDPGVYVNLGNGIAAALTVGGRVVRGAHQAAGEIGYLTLDPTAVGAVTDGRVPLKEIIGGKALGERGSRLLGAQLTAAAVFARTDPPALQMVHHALGALATAVANIAVFIDPERVVIGGGLMGSAPKILSVLSAHLQHTMPFPPEIVAAYFTQNASLHGAIALALDMAKSENAPAVDPPRHPIESPAGALT